MSAFGKKVKLAIAEIILDRFTAIPYELEELQVTDMEVTEISPDACQIKVWIAGMPNYYTVKVTENT